MKDKLLEGRLVMFVVMCDSGWWCFVVSDSEQAMRWWWVIMLYSLNCKLDTLT